MILTIFGHKMSFFAYISGFLGIEIKLKMISFYAIISFSCKTVILTAKVVIFDLKNGQTRVFWSFLTSKMVKYEYFDHL